MVEKSQSVIDNKENLMKLSGAKIIDDHVEFTETDNVFLILDTETSGLDETKDKIVQFSGIKYKIDLGKMVEIDRLDIYINQPEYDENKIIPGKNGDPDITFKDLSGITNDMLKDAPVEAEAFKVISKFIGDNPIFIAFNTPFDYKFICQMYIRNGEVLHTSKDRTLDVLVMAKDLVSPEEAPVLLNANGDPVCDKNGKPKKTWKLSYIANLYGLDKDEEDTAKTIAFHSSINDVVVTGRLLNTFISEYKTQMEEELSKPPVEKHRAQVYSIRYWAGYRGFSRVYVNAHLNGDVVSYYYDVRKKIWGGKEEGLVEQTMMPELKADALELAGCEDETSFGKITEDIDADATFLSRYS